MILTEGRKEDIYNKYKNKIDVERKLNSSVEPISIYDILIQDPYIQDTNYKFLDSLIQQHYFTNEIYPRQGKELEELEPNTVATSRDSIINKRNFVNTVVPKVQFFENNKDKYPKKDLRGYVGNLFDRDFLDFTTDLMLKQSKKNEGKEAKKDSIKLYEDDNILVVKPLTHKASCYYGSGTKWCTTMAGSPTYFNEYSRKGNLYYIILKKIARESKYAKIALLLKPDVNFDDGEFYDTKDHLLTKNEIELFKNFVIQNAVNSINSDSEKSFKKKWLSTLENEIKNSKQLFKFREYQLSFNKLSPNKPLIMKFEVLNFSEFSDMGDFGEDEGNHINYEMDIKVTCNQSDNLNGIITVVGMVYDMTSSEYEFQCGFESENESFGLPEYETFVRTIKKPQENILINIIDNIILGVLFPELKSSKEMENMYENWVDNNVKRTYGSFGGSQYTFEGGGKLTKEIINYLDELPEGQKGNRLEFLQKTGKVTTTDKGNFSSSGKRISLQGYLSSWFSALNKAGIIQTKSGQKGFTKGSNFEKFKEKILTKK